MPSGRGCGQLCRNDCVLPWVVRVEGEEEKDMEGGGMEGGEDKVCLAQVRAAKPAEKRRALSCTVQGKVLR